MKKSPVVVIVACLAAVIVTGVVLRYTASRPENAAGDFSAAFSAGNWATVYDMATEKEKDLQDWGKDEFVALLKSIERERTGEISNVTWTGDWRGRSTSKLFIFDYESSIGGDAHLDIIFFRDVDGWRPAIYHLPLLLHNYGNEPTDESLKVFYDACSSAEISTFVRIDQKEAYSVDRLGRYLAGEIGYESVAIDLTKPVGKPDEMPAEIRSNSDKPTEAG